MYGLEVARQKARQLTDEAIKALKDDFTPEKKFLCDLAIFNINRDYW